MFTNIQNLGPALLTLFQSALDEFYSKSRPTGISEAYRSVTVEKEETQDYALGDVSPYKPWNEPRTYPDLERWDMTLKSKPFTAGEFRIRRIENVGRNATSIREKMSRGIEIASQIPDYEVIKAIEAGETTDAYDGAKFFLKTTAERNYANMIDATGTDEDHLKADIDSAEELLDKVQSNTGNKLAITSNIILAPTSLYKTFRKITTSTADTADNKNAGVTNLYSGWTAMKVPELSGNSWYILTNSTSAFPAIWQTTTTEGQGIVLDVDNTTLASMGSYGVAVSTYGAAALAHPFTIIKVKA